MAGILSQVRGCSVDVIRALLLQAVLGGVLVVMGLETGGVHLDL